MSSDMLGLLVRALTAVPQARLGLLTDFAHKLSGSNGEEWEKNGALFLSKEPVWANGPAAQAPTPTAWTVDAEGDIHFTVVSNGMSPQQWEHHLESRGFRLSDWARNVLRRASEAPTNGVAYHIVVRPCSKISSRDRVTKKIRAHATEKGWKTPHWEVACLIRDTFTDEQLEKMGLRWIVTMHEPIIDYGGVPCLLLSNRNGVGLWLDAGCDRPGGRWDRDNGFAFAVSQVSSQT